MQLQSEDAVWYMSRIRPMDEWRATMRLSLELNFLYTTLSPAAQNERICMS